MHIVKLCLTIQTFNPTFTTCQQMGQKHSEARIVTLLQSRIRPYRGSPQFATIIVTYMSPELNTVQILSRISLLLQHSFNVDWSSIPISATNPFCSIFKSICKIGEEYVEMSHKLHAIKQKVYSTIKNKKLSSNQDPFFF